LWFLPLIRCKTPKAGDGQRGRLLCHLGGVLSVPVSLSHYLGGVALVGVVSGRSVDIRTSVRNKCSILKNEGFSENLPESLTES
jgi:hypothetical protein